MSPQLQSIATFRDCIGSQIRKGETSCALLRVRDILASWSSNILSTTSDSSKAAGCTPKSFNFKRETLLSHNQVTVTSLETCDTIYPATHSFI
ncbi:hypothetical protein HBH56_105700 [Parastagonospora nodorum]|nr:hypothetical protein HBH56_105700 [Parastagonospora nodorum]KAH3929627.1 hypothetical protein HBH54_124710 [Parastagonospora nodorum]KAH3951415.1 hypothetical protein HBH53_058710 [Parastagonospora nodorum]KAH3975495.1 hypothetical protein HBH52_128160 [Parastagonospora nodorum]KAH4032311.1 hypothetical protein HBI09_117220 [Parastagonospora nodorum]